VTAAVDARRLADMQAVYRMFDSQGHLLYIGVTGDLGKRLGQHLDRRWFPLVERITLEWFASRAAALVAERRAICAEHPRYNLDRTPPKKEAPKVRRAAVQKPTAPIQSRHLLDDLDEVVGDSRVKLRDAIGLLRNLAPGFEPYQKMTAVRLRDELKLRGVRVINTSGTPWLDPIYLRVTLKKAG
jgi:hypothetical protein